eukprot:c24598_g1_i3 orf=202-843(+)
MDSLATLHTALDAAFSKLNESTSSETGFSNSSVQDASLEITDRATWAEVVCGQEKDHRTGTDVQVTSHYTHDGHDKTTYQKHQQLDHNGQRRHPSENKCKQEVEGNNEAWQTVVGKHHHLNSHQESCASAKQYHKPDGHTQLISVQFLWNGILKPLSSTFIGVSPEFELALYTLCFYAGQEDNFVQVGPYSVNIKCYRYGRDKIGSAFPIAED